MSQVVLHLQAVGEALCNLALISLSGKESHNRQRNPDLIKITRTIQRQMMQI